MSLSSGYTALWSDIQSLYTRLNTARSKHSLSSVGVPGNSGTIKASDVSTLNSYVTSTASSVGVSISGVSLPSVGSLITPTALNTISSNITIIQNYDPALTFYYTGTCTLNGSTCSANTQYSASGNWEIHFLTSGTLHIYNKGAQNVDIYTLGGGGGGCVNWGGWRTNIGGGGGGYVANQYNQALSSNTDYTIVVGSGGSARWERHVDEAWSAWGGSASSISGSGISCSASGGGAGIACSGYWGGFGGAKGGSGGSGGAGACFDQTFAGGYNGGNGGASSERNGYEYTGGTGAGSWTGPFGSWNPSYAHGGDAYATGDYGGDNSGNGGGRESITGKSGRVVMRNKR